MKKVLKSIIWTFVFFLLVSTVKADLTDGLVGYWSFDEGFGNIAYDSVNDNDGLIFSATWTTGFIGDYALDFDGTNYVDIGDTIKNSLGVEYTVSAWIKTNTLTGNHQVVSYRQSYWPYGGQPALLFQLDQLGPDIRFIVADDHQHILFANYYNILTTEIWYHVAGVRAGNTLAVYVNGVSGTPSSGTLIDPISSDNLKIGALYLSGKIHHLFNGIIDDVRIYNRALSEEEIQALYQMAFKPDRLEIIGPNEVVENSQAQYKAILVYDNGDSKDITEPIDWAVNPDLFAQINEDGLLETGILNMPTEQVTVYAEYTDSQTTLTAEKQVEIFASCPEGHALEFDGRNDYIIVPNTPAQQINNNQLTICAWIQLYSDVGNTQKRIICKQQKAVTAWGLEIFGKNYAGSTGNQLVFHDSDGYSAWYNCMSDTHLELNKWYHVCVTDDSGSIKIYIDGQLDKSSDAGYGIPSAINAPIMIGKTNPETSFFFHGALDEIAVFNRILTPEEIAAMSAGENIIETNLIGYWNLEEGSGQVVYDNSGNGNDGYLGTDPCDVDDSDPAWIDSDAPIRCTREQMIERNLYGALEHKEIAEQEIRAALDKEQATNRMLLQIWREQNIKKPGPWQIWCNYYFKKCNSMQIWRAMQYITGSMIKEYNSMKLLSQSIKDLEDAAKALNIDEQN